MPKEKQLYAQIKTVHFRVYEYFHNLEECGGGRGALIRISKATGERTSYCCVLVGTFTVST